MLCDQFLNLILNIRVQHVNISEAIRQITIVNLCYIAICNMESAAASGGIDCALKRSRQNRILKIHFVRISQKHIAAAACCTRLRNVEHSIGIALDVRAPLFAVHVAEHEYSRMVTGGHFVSDEERSGALLPRSSPTLNTARCHVIADSF